MKKDVLLCILALAVGSCGSMKKVDNEKLYGATWELDYITGPRIAFEGLFPDIKPQITFDAKSNKVSGNAGCNGYSADYTLNGKAISFGEPGPATLMYCGEGEGVFLKMMRKVDGYSIDTENRLNLMAGEVPLLRFKRMSTVLQKGCYTYDENGTTIDLEITENGDSVTGNLAYALSGKDKNTGTFKGRLKDDKLIGEYTFRSEGVESSREVAFMVKGGRLIEGYGEMTDEGTAFKDPDAIDYSSKMPLAKTDCSQ